MIKLILTFALFFSVVTLNAQVLNFKKTRTVFLASFGKNPALIQVLNSIQDLDKNYVNAKTLNRSSYENIKSFFVHGGKNAIIYSMSNNNLNQALKFLERNDFDLVVASELRELNEAQFSQSIKKIKNVLDFKRAHLVLDIPRYSNLITLKNYISAQMDLASPRVSIFYPDLLTLDQFQFPSSGMAAAYFYFNDMNVGSWKVCGINCVVNTQFTPLTSFQMKDIVFINDQSAIAVNLIFRPKIDSPFVLFNSRTTSSNSDFKYTSVSRTNDLIYKAILNQLSWVKNAKNDLNTWQKIKTDLNAIFTNYWISQMIKGSKPENAFVVKVGLNETMTGVEISKNQIVIRYGLAFVRESEFVTTEIVIQQ